MLYLKMEVLLCVKRSYVIGYIVETHLVPARRKEQVLPLVQPQ